MKRRVLSLAVALAMCLELCPVWALAAGGEAEGELSCRHHPAHTEECGYAPPEPGHACTHAHGDDCYTTETVCVHTHTAACCSDPESGTPDLCTHVCTEESGCVTPTLSCQHVHDDACGYVPATPGSPCTFVCRICPIEALIGQLPDSLTEDNSEQVQLQLAEIYTLYEELTGEEQAQVDMAPCAALLDQMDGLETESLSGNDDPTYRELKEDETYDTPFVVSAPLKIVTNEYKIIGKSTAIQVTSAGSLELTGRVSGGEKGYGVEVQSGGSLRITGENTYIMGSEYALYIASDAKVEITAGTFSAKSGTPIYVEDGNYAGLLPPGFALFDDKGNKIPPELINQTSSATITLRPCTDHQKNYTHTHAPTHTWTCAFCGTSGTESCTFSFNQDGKGVCALCQNEISVEVDQESLKELAYDEGIRPANGTVTVRVKDAEAALVPDTDYTASYKTRADMGSANITVTVTVTGKTYTGTFTKDFAFTKEELKPPLLQWNATGGVSLPYTASPVTKGQLPGVTINITSDVDLHDQLRYAYRKQGDSAYTDGLPTDAGTYEVVVSLPAGTDYQAASSEPITLEIEPIAPIAAPPAAALPTYNGTAQELVTPGTLGDAAKRDGLTIQFATSETGTYSATIPTGTNAGGYTVWYKVVGLTDNYIAPAPNPAPVSDVKILRKRITPVVELSQSKYLYDGGWKEPAVTVKDADHVTVLLNTEYQVEYQNNRNVSTDTNPAKVVVTDSDPNGGNYDLERVEVEFQITQKTQDTLSITQKPDTVTYGDQFTLSTTGGSDSGSVTWEITAGVDVAQVGQNSGQVTIIGGGTATVKATKSGGNNYEDATDTWTFDAAKKPVTAAVTAEDKVYDGDTDATVHAVVESGVLPGDVITIENLTGTFSDENAGADKTVTVVTAGATITGHNSKHYAVSYSSTTAKATIEKKTVEFAKAPVPASLTYNGSAQMLIATGAEIDPATVVAPDTVQVEYALSEAGPYSIDFPKGTDAGDYTVWYRVRETNNYTGLAPASVDVTIAKKPVSPVIALDQASFTYDGTAKKPVVTLYEADGTTVIPDSEYTVAYSGNINVGTGATVTVTAKPEGNYRFENAPVTKTFTITEEQAQVLTAPEPAGRPLFFANYAQQLVTAGTAEGGTMVYRVGTTGDFKPEIPERTDAGTYNVYYKVQGDSNHSDSDEGRVEVTIAPKVVTQLTIELKDANGDPFQSCVYSGSAWRPTAVVKDGSDIISAGEYEIVYSDNKDAGRATVSITDKPDGNYTVTGHTTFEILKADIVFTTAPSAANPIYSGEAQELLAPCATSGGTVLYALGTSTSEYRDHIPTGVNAGTYKVFYKVTGDKNHNDFPITEVPNVTIQRKQLTAPTIELTPDSFQYDTQTHLPAVTVKDGDTVLPDSEYAWACDVSDPKNSGTYTITVTDKTGGNYDLNADNPNTATFTIGTSAQAELTIEGQREHVYYGDTFTLTVGGGSGTGAVTWSVEGPATVADGNVTVTGVGDVTVTAEKAGDTNYDPASARWTFTAAPKPVTASVTVSDKPYDGTTTATVATVTVPTVNVDTVTITPASIAAAFADPHAGTDKTVVLDVSGVQVGGADVAKYAISYPATVKADITQATTSITTLPAAINGLIYSGQPQALVTAGQTNVGFLVYSLDGTSFSPEIPTGTDAGTYNVYYKVDGTSDYTGVAVNATPIPVTIGPKDITGTVKVELSEKSFLYDGTEKNPVVTVLDGKTVIDSDQYTVTWANDDSTVTEGLLTAAGTYTATITNVANGNYTFTTTASVKITPAEQAALSITGQPEHVYYGDVIATLRTTGGTGEGSVKWSVTAGTSSAEINAASGVLTIKGVGSVTVRAERAVPNYGTVSDTWSFTVEPKPVTAEVTVAAKTYDGTTNATVATVTVPTINGDTVTIAPASITATFDTADAGADKPVTLNSAGAAKADDDGKYAISYPAAATATITRKSVTVAVTLSDHDLQGDAANGYYYAYNGGERKPNVIVTYDTSPVTIPESNYTVAYSGNQNVGTATVTVTAKESGNYTFADTSVYFEIRRAGAVLTTTPMAKELTYNGSAQDLVTAGVATGGNVVYSTEVEGPYTETIPQETNAGTYMVYYMVRGDSNHADTAAAQVSVTIQPKVVTSPKITLEQNTYVYDGTAKTPAVTSVMDGTDTIVAGEYTVGYQNNTDAGTATVVIRDVNGGNYDVRGTADFTITAAAPTVTAPTARTLTYNGEAQELVTAGVTGHGVVVYAVNGGNYSAAVPTATAVGDYTISWKVQGDLNHSDTAEATLTAKIEKNKVTKPGITLSQDQFTYDGEPHRPTITVKDDSGRVIAESEYVVTISAGKPTNTSNMVDVDTYTITVTTPASSNYEITTDNTRTYRIIEAEQEAIYITGAPSRVFYGDTIPLGVSGGSGSGTVTWEVTGGNNEISATGLLTVKDVGGPCTVTVTRSRGDNYTDVSATWEFTAAKKPVTAIVTAADRSYVKDDVTADVTAVVPGSELVHGDSLTIIDLTGSFANDSVGDHKTVTLVKTNVTITGTNAEKYEVTIPDATTASILSVVATVTKRPAAKDLTYDASQSQELVTAGVAEGGDLVYSLDGINFMLNLPTGKDAGTYTVYYKVQSDSNHKDSAVDTVEVTIKQQTVEAADLRIELTPPSAQYDSQAHYPEVTLRDGAGNLIPESEYQATYDTGTNWTNVGTHKVKITGLAGGNYIIKGAEEDFEIKTSAQAPLTIVNKPGEVHYGDTFTLSATGGSGSAAVQWSSSNTSVATIDGNGFVRVVGVGTATITATKSGGTNYGEATATYPMNAQKKMVTVAVTAEDKVYDGTTSATLHFTWTGLVGSDEIDTTGLTGAFADALAGSGKRVNISGTGPTSDKYEFTIPVSTTASITRAIAAPPSVTAVEDLVYDGTAKALVTGGEEGKTLYSDGKDGTYSATVPGRINAGTYTVWYKTAEDENHSESEAKSVQVTIKPKTLESPVIELSGNDLQVDTTVTPNVYFYQYDGTDRTPAVTVKDGNAIVPASEYAVGYSANRNVGTATVTITDHEGGNYTVTDASVNFDIRRGVAVLTTTPMAKELTYNGSAQDLVTTGVATGGNVVYSTEVEGPYTETIPQETNAGTYTVYYKVQGDSNHDGTAVAQVSVTIQPKVVTSPKITVGGSYTYTGEAQIPADGAVKVEDGGTLIPASEYIVTCRNNINAGSTATVVISDANGGNYDVSGTATFEIAKAAAAVGTAPVGKTGLKYNGEAQELVTAGHSDDGTLVYSLSENGKYSTAIPTGKDRANYTVYYKVLGDSNHNDSVAQSVSASIVVNIVTNAMIKVTPESVTFTGEKQTPAVTVRDDSNLLIDSDEYTVTYADANNSGNGDLIQVGTYTVTVASKGGGNYSFSKTAEFTILEAEQTPLTITGTRERVYYGDTIRLGVTGGSASATLTWEVDSTIASIDNSGLLTITGVGPVTVTVTSKKAGFANQTATWGLHVERKPVTALVTAKPKTYDGTANAEVTATLQTGDFVGSDRFTIALDGCTFEDPNVGTGRKVNVDSTNPRYNVTAGGAGCYANYVITYPAIASASITKADLTAGDVTAPQVVADLVYTGQPIALVTAGSSDKGTLEYSTDGSNYSASLPTGTNAGDYSVWYRVKGDNNHNDTAGTKLSGTVTIQRKEVSSLSIEFTPGSASFDGQEHKPTVTVKDADSARVIPASEYTVDFGSTNWRDEGDHTVTITGKADGNYHITADETDRSAKYTILPAGQSALSIVGKPTGTIRYGDSFYLSTSGGSGTGALTWESSNSQVASVNSQSGEVKVLKAGELVTITARKAAGGGYGETTATWSFNAEKRPVTAIVTADDRPYQAGNRSATVHVTWSGLVGNDIINTSGLTGTFSDDSVGTGKKVTLSGIPSDERYDITFPTNVTASITATAATVTGVQSGPWIYNGSEQPLLSGGTVTNGTLVYSRNRVDFMESVPMEQNAGKYTVYYKARGNTNYADSDVYMVEVTIQAKTVNSPAIQLLPDTFEYDGTAKRPTVVVKDGGAVIPASEYTVGYGNNIDVGTASVTITDNSGGNYTVNGIATFSIKAGAASLLEAPEPRENLTYTGMAQQLVTAGSAVNGKLMYAVNDGEYSTTIPKATNADTYQVWYKVVSTDGTTETDADYVEVTIDPQVVTNLTIRLEGQNSYSVAYNGKEQKPEVTVYVGTKQYNELFDFWYTNNMNVGTAEVTVQSMGGNYEFLASKTFTITKGKAEFLDKPTALNSVYDGTAKKLVKSGTSEQGIVLYSLDSLDAFSTAIPTAVDRGSYTVYAKVQGSSNYEESEILVINVEISVNTVGSPQVILPANSFPYTGSEIRPTVTVLDDDLNVIDSGEYTVVYHNNMAVGEATIKIRSRTNSNYSFEAEAKFQITDASQTSLTIIGQPDVVYYGDRLDLGVTGGSGTVTWQSSSRDIAEINANGTVEKIKTSGSVTITATRGGSSVSWTFVAKPRPVTALVTAQDKVYGEATTLTVTLSGLVPGDTVRLTATGDFLDQNAGTNKKVLISGLNGLESIRDQYVVTYNQETTASITPVPASVTGSVTGRALTYNGGAQQLVDITGVTAEGGNLAYSLDGSTYTLSFPTATDVGSYPVWYKVIASDTNHTDSAPVSVSQVPRISADPNKPSAVQCSPSSFAYDGTRKIPTVVVLDSTGQHIIPASEYTVEITGGKSNDPVDPVDVDTYTVNVTDKPGGNYAFNDVVTGTFQIVVSSQAPLSITDKPASVCYGDTFYLSATGGSGSGAVKWSIAEASIAEISDSGMVTVKGVGSFTVRAYREASGGYSQSNVDSVTFAANPKPVTPVVTASDKPYDRTTAAVLTASLRESDKVNAGDTVTLSVIGAFASPDAGVGKRVDLGGRTVGGTDAAKYAINWPDYVTATINRVDAQISAAPVALSNLRADGTDHALVSAGTTVNDIGVVVYSLDQNGTYSTAVPTASAAGTYRVWYKIADSANYTGVAPAYVDVVIAAASADTSSDDSDSTDDSLSSTGGSVVNDANTLSTYSTPARTTVSNNAANTVLSASEGSSMVRQAAANQSKTIVIQPEVSDNVTKSEVSIPASTLGQIQRETDAALTVAAPVANVTIPNAAMNTLSSAGGTVDVVTEQVGDAVALTLSAGGEKVESVPGGVTLSVPVEDAGPGTVAVLVNEDGSREVIQKSVAKDGAVSIPLDGSATVEIVDNSKAFEDVPAESWAADAVAFASAHELFNGTSETTFSPDVSMSRGMLTTVLYNLENQPNQDLTMEDLTDRYSDVNSDAWYAEGVAWAVENGIATGYGDGQFGPNDNVTREQLAVMLWKYAGGPEASGDTLDFTDADQASSYAREALCWAAESGIMNGYNGELDPKGTATRAQAAQMLKNFMENT